MTYKKVLLYTVAVVFAIALLVSCESAPAQRESAQPTPTPTEEPVPQKTADANTVSAEDLAALEVQAQSVADALVSNHGTVSVQYALMDGDDLVLSGTSGVFDKTSNAEVKNTDMYGIGSTSKMYLTAAVMKLWDEGLVGLDEPLTTYIPEFSMADERYKYITVRMLLNHSSGLYGSSFSDAFLFDDPDTTTVDTLLERLATQRLKADPGEFSEYTNDGFTLAQILVQRISGESFTDYIAENFTEPLGLAYTKTPQNDFDKSRQIAKTYHGYYGGALPNDTINVIATGGIYSTAEELCRFGSVLMGKAPDILSKEATELMQNEEYKRGDIWPADSAVGFFSYGLGWDSVENTVLSQYGIRAMSKGGDTELFHSNLTVVPEYNLSMAVTSSGSASVYDNAFCATILEQYLSDKGIISEIITPDGPTKPTQVDMPKELEENTGLFGNQSTLINVKVSDGIMSFDGKQEAVYVGDGLFQTDDGTTSYQFTIQGDGNTYLERNQSRMISDIGYVRNIIDLFMQKLETVDVPQFTLDAWTKRAGKRYFLISEPPSGQDYYLGGGDHAFFAINEDFRHGYVHGGIKIAGTNLAIDTLKFRDGTDLVFETRDGVEYLFANDLVYMREDSIPPLTEETSNCVIADDGYAEYFTIGADVQGKIITVDIPVGAAYAVYDKDGGTVNFTTVSHENKTVLPENGLIAFIGSAGDEFKFVI